MSGGDAGAPAGGMAEAPRNAVAGVSTSIEATTDRSREVEAARAWAEPYLQRTPGSVPRFGSQEWAELDAREPAKVSACIAAALAWLTSAVDLEADLRTELDGLRLAEKQAEDAAYRAEVAEHREQWGGMKLARGAWADRRGFGGAA